MNIRIFETWRHTQYPEGQQTAIPCYTVEAPQEFDEPGKELSPGAQVWKTYVREADQVDEELVDGWNSLRALIVPPLPRNTPSILTFLQAALFSAISTAFVIESYKNLKQDPADVSAHILLAISHTLTLISNGSQPTSAPPISKLETLEFKVPAKAVCVNALWFLSLSLSVAVSLISMLAKEWCLEFMSGRNGPPGAQARRRQQRWDGIVGWRVKEVVALLPSLLHLSLLLFAIGLCVFLWEVHFGVAVPVVIVTTLAAIVYFSCTILPFLYDFCPYGTVLSRLYKQFSNSRSILDEGIQDKVTTSALHWMIVNCETPRSADVALQSLAAAGEDLPPGLLEECNAWTMIKRRLGSATLPEQNCEASHLYERALAAYPNVRRRADQLRYGEMGETRKLEQLVLSVQSCVSSVIREIPFNTSIQGRKSMRILKRSTLIGRHYLAEAEITRDLPVYDAGTYAYAIPVEPEILVEDIVDMLEQYLQGKIILDPTVCGALFASMAFALCCNVSRGTVKQSVNAGYTIRLIRAYRSGPRKTEPPYLVQNIKVGLLLGTVWVLIASDYSKSAESTPSARFTSPEKALDALWVGLMIIFYTDQFVITQPNSSYLVYGMLHILANPERYNLNCSDSDAILEILRDIRTDCGFSGRIQYEQHAHYIHDISRNLAATGDVTLFMPQFIGALRALKIYSPWDNDYLLPTPEIYIFLVQTLMENPDPRARSLARSLLRRCPFPKHSPRLTELLSTHDIVTRLSNSLNKGEMDEKAFAVAQLWLLFNMALQVPDRTNPALNILETMLLQYAGLENNLNKQEDVMEELEFRLMALLNRRGTGFWLYLEGYLYRVVELMLQRKCAPLPETACLWLKSFPQRLRGVSSLVNLETERSVAYPNVELVEVSMS